MDPEQRARRQSFRLIVSEIVMVIAVVAMVVVLAFLVSGYWLGSDFKVERQGMLQINSVPTGATVAVDGDAPWYQRTNTSKVLATGEHTIALTKDNYDSWSRTINIREGLLYRIYYPRLFLLERDKEPILSTPTTTTATVSPDRNTMLLINNTTLWQLLNLSSTQPEAKSLNISPYFASVSLTADATAGLFSGSITSIAWSSDNEHILVRNEYNGTAEWVILNVKNPSASVNLTREFKINFTDIRIFNHSASTLLATASSNLYKLDLSSPELSDPLITNVQNYSFYDQEIIFTAKNPDSTYYTGIIKINDPKITTFTTSDIPTRAYLSRFYEDKYVTLVSDSTISVYKRDDPEPIFESPLAFNPNTIKISRSGDFVFMNTGTSIMTFDMEALSLREWTLDSISYGWIDSNMLYAVADGTLIVYDFDGLNRRVISGNVSSHFPVTITGDKWLYYFSDNQIIRETIVQ